MLHHKAFKEDAHFKPYIQPNSLLGVGAFCAGQEPLVQKLIIVPLYIQCETAGGETQCAGSLNLTATVHNVLTFLQRAYKCARSSKLSYLLLYGLLLAQA